MSVIRIYRRKERKKSLAGGERWKTKEKGRIFGNNAGKVKTKGTKNRGAL